MPRGNTGLRAFLLAAALALSATSAGHAAEAAPRRVGTAIVLAIDGSASISGGGLEFQLRGHAAAFRDPVVIDAASVSGIAATLTVFSGPHTLKVLVPWTVVSNAAEAEAFADRIEHAERGVRADSTALGSAILDALPLFERSGVQAARRVVDLVSNGFGNSGPEPMGARDLAAARGVTVNALVILDEYDWLEEYFRDNVIGGPQSFVTAVADSAGFAEALRHKLVMEIAALPTRD